jgi:hypothetical protein
MVIGIFSPALVYCTKKNLATLLLTNACMSLCSALQDKSVEKIFIGGGKKDFNHDGEQLICEAGHVRAPKMQIFA